MLESLNTIAWQSRLQPGSNDPDSVPSALRDLANSKTSTESQAAYHRLLFATGNDHAGTYYPVVLDVLPFVAEIVRAGAAPARLAALDILIDFHAFCPEPGHEIFTGPDAAPRALESLVRQAIATYWVALRSQVLSAGLAEEVALARELDLEVAESKVSAEAHV